MKALSFFIIIVATLVTLLACQRPAPQEPTPTPIPTPTITLPPTPTPSPTPTVAVTPTSTPSVAASPTTTRRAPTPVTVPANFQSYRDQIFGFQISHPPTWKAETTESPSPVMELSGPQNGQPQGRVHVVYNRDVASADAVVDNLLPQFLQRTGFRTLEEGELALRDGTMGFQTTFQWTEQGTMQGILFAVTRGSQGMVMIMEGPQNVFQANLEDMRAMLSSFHLEEPAPLGIPHSQALTLYFDEGPLILDPAVAQESQSLQYVTQIFTGLVSFDPGLVLTPELAGDWKITGNGTIFTFTLRDTARFHDGRRVTAKDFKYSWERAVTRATGSPTAGTYLNDIVGMPEFTSGKATEVSGIKVVDERTLQVTIDAPKAYFLSKLAHPVSYVVDRTEIEARITSSGDPWWVEPNGTGPFRMRKWIPGVVMVLEANKEFYVTPPRTPYVVFRLMGGLPSLMYQDGEIDAAQVFAEQLKEITNPANPLSRALVTTPELSVHYVGFTANKPPFSDPLVRRAFLLATDRAKLLREVAQDTQELAHGFLPPGLPGYNPAISTIPYDPKAALDLLARSSYGGADKLPRIVYTTSGFAQASPQVEALLAMWRENLKVSVQVRLLDPSLYYYALDSGVDNLFDFGWIADYPDPHNFLDVLFHSGADNNKGTFRSPPLDTLLNQARVEQDPQKRQQMYQAAEKILVDDAAGIPLYFGRGYRLVKPYVRDLVFTPLGTLDLRKVSLVPR